MREIKKNKNKKGRKQFPKWGIVEPMGNSLLQELFVYLSIRLKVLLCR